MLPGADSMPAWVDLVVRLSKAPFISIASIRGRTRGGGNELALASCVTPAGSMHCSVNLRSVPAFFQEVERVNVRLD